MMSLNLDKSKKYLLACSFGPDSMALFYLLKKEDYKFDAAIVNYHLRKESDFEVSSLKKYCKENDVALHVLDVKKTPSRNIEAKCREIRYKYFSELTIKYGYDAVLVAQHQDDLIETYILQKERQITPKYYGIDEKTQIQKSLIIRPLLNYMKVELKEICDSNNIPYSIDKSNFDTTIKRNKIRHEFVAKLTLLNRQKLLEEINKKNSAIKSLLSAIDMNKLNSVQYLKSLDDLSLVYALNILFNKVDESTNLSKDNVGEICKVINSDHPNVLTKVKGNVYLLKEYDSFRFVNYVNSNAEYSYQLNGPDKLDTPYFYLDFTKDSSNRNVYETDYPLIIRNARSDDKVKIKDYCSTVKRLLIDWKMPISLRNRWPVIVNSKGEVIYIPRYQKDFKPTLVSNFYVKI